VAGNLPDEVRDVSTRPAAIQHEEIIAAVATLTERMEHVLENQQRMEQKIDKIDLTVHGPDGHAEQIAAWKRTGKMLAFALTGLGAIGMALFQWFLAHWK
jgi:hypothetical protein